MSNEQIHEIKEALSLLSAERVNTSGLGAPINILKRLIEDSEEPTSANNAQVELAVQNVTNALPSARDFIGIIHKHLLFHPHSDQIIDCIESYAELVRSNEREKIEKESEMCQCGSERIGSTKLWCCNQCGKRHEKF